MKQSMHERFWSKVNKDGPVPVHAPHLGQCWVWTASKNPLGYGWFGIGSKVDRAHRVSYSLEYGPIPHGMFVCHACDNPSCVRPEHLFIGDQKANMMDCARKGRWTPRSMPCGDAHPLRRHPESAARGERVGLSKLKEKDVREIRASTDSQRVLAKRFNVDRRSISLIRQGKTWKHVA